MTRAFVLVLAIGGAAATFLPWQIWGDTVYDGWHVPRGGVSFGAFVAAALCGAYRPLWYVKIALFVIGMVAIGCAARSIGEIGQAQRALASALDVASRKEAASLRVGLGAWVVVAASLGLVISAFVWKRPKPGQAAPLPKATVV